MSTVKKTIKKAVAKTKSKVIKITKQLCTNALFVIDRGLSKGLSNGGKVCIEYAISIAAGTPEDRAVPTCVDKKLSSFKINLNDDNALWKDDDDRASGLRRIGIAQLGTNKQKNFWKRFEKAGIEFQKALLAKYAPAVDRVEIEQLIDNADWGELETIFSKLSGRASYDIINPGEFGDSGFINNLLDAINNDGEAVVAKKELLDDYLEGLVQILKKLKTPGSKFLYLTEGKRKLKPTKEIEGYILKLNSSVDAENIDWNDEFNEADLDE